MKTHPSSPQPLTQSSLNIERRDYTVQSKCFEKKADCVSGESFLALSGLKERKRSIIQSPSFLFSWTFLRRSPVSSETGAHLNVASRRRVPGNAPAPPPRSASSPVAYAFPWRQSAPSPSIRRCWCGVQSARVLDPYGAGGWAPQSHYGGPPHWCEPRPGRSSDPVTPIGGPLRQVDSPFHAACPVHSPFRFRFVNGGPDYHHPHHQVMNYSRRVFACWTMRRCDRRPRRWPAARSHRGREACQGRSSEPPPTEPR